MKPKKCKYCKSEFDPVRPLQQCCSFDCSVGYAKEQQEKKRAASWRQKKARMKESIKSLSSYKKDLQIVINQIVRKIDENFDCISCDKSEGRFDAGHRLSVKAYPNLRFNLLNNFKQCSWNCNHMLSGNPDKYDDKLIKLFGKEMQEHIRFGLNQKYLRLDLSKEQTKEALRVARGILNTLEPAKTNRERIEKRIEINNKIGIYC